MHDRTVNLFVSDPHFGSDVKAENTGGLNYCEMQERKAFNYIIDQACDYKSRYRAHSQLNLILGGDLIPGDIHETHYYPPITEQIDRARKHLQRGIDQLAKEYGLINVFCVRGNHDRISARHPGRASTGAFDSYATQIYQSLSVPKNCIMRIPRTPYARISVFNHSFLVAHGDGMLRIPNPGKTLNLAKIEAQVNRWSLARFRPDVVMVGHHHTPLVTVLPSGTRFIVNGSNRPNDEFSLSCDYAGSHPAQILFESTPEYAVGDLRIISIPLKLYR